MPFSLIFWQNWVSTPSQVDQRLEMLMLNFSKQKQTPDADIPSRKADDEIGRIRRRKRRGKKRR